MSGYLSSLVRRGAGLPLPVSVRPPARHESLQATGASFAPASELDANVEPTRSETISVSAGNDASVTKPHALPPPLLQQITPVQAGSRESDPSPLNAQKPEPRMPLVAMPFLPQLPPRNASGDSSHQDVKPARPDSTARDGGIGQTRQGTARANPHLGKISHVDSTPIVPQKTAKAEPGPPPPGTQFLAAIPRQEPAAHAHALEQRSSPDSRSETAATEARNIQVKIGKIEIRSSQPALPARQVRKPSNGGFGDLNLARTYLDRSR